MAYNPARCMTHDQVIDYVEGNLNADDWHAMDEHLRGCHCCRTEVQKESDFQQRLYNAAVKDQDLADSLLERNYPTE